MSVDLETRLRAYADVLDSAIELDLTRDIELTGPLDDEMIPVSVPASGPRRSALVAVAAAGLLVGGCLAMLIDHHSESEAPAAQTTSDPSTNTTIQSPAPSTTIPADDPSLWDPIRVAPGTGGWYEFGDIPAALRSRVGAIESWTTTYTASFYRCATYTVDANGPICNGLIGGNFVAPTTFAGSGELGTHLGDMSTADLAWTLAQGSLWGYDEVTSAPPATPVAVGAHAGLMYSNNDTSYLVWEQSAGVHLWIRATDMPTDDMVGLALTVRPATLPDRLPLPIVVDAVSTSGAPSYDELVIGSHPGMPLCAQITTSNGCVSLPPVTDVAIVVGADGPITAVAAVFPIGSEDRLRVDLADADPVTVEPVVSPLGFQYAIFRPGTERIIGGGVVAPDGAIVATATLTTAPAGATATTIETTSGPLEEGPASVHSEEGTYVVAPGDFPSTIAAKFKVAFQDLLALNRWTIVDNQVPEFPPAGATIRIPPGWTEPAMVTGGSTTN